MNSACLRQPLSIADAKVLLFSEPPKLFRVFFKKKLLIHPVSIVFIPKTAQNLQLSIIVEHANGGMCDTVEGIRLHRRVVYHILEYHLLAHLQFVVEAPIAHEVATQTAVATQAINLTFEL